MVDASGLKQPAAGVWRDPRLALKDFASGLQDDFGIPFLRYVVVTYFGLKGVCYGLLGSATLPLFQAMHVSGNRYQLAGVVMMTPWSLKGWIGVLSDIVPIGRFHKRGYLLIAAFIGVVGVATLVSTESSSLGSNWVWGVAVCFASGEALVATFDLLCEGKYSELMRGGQTGSAVLTLVWSSVQFGGLVCALFVGATVDKLGPRPLIGMCLPFMLLGAWRTAAGDLPEEPARSWSSLRLKARSAPGLFVCAGAMAAGSLTTALCAAFLSKGPRNAIVVLVCLGLIALSFQVLPRTLACCNLYLFIINVAYLDVSGPLSYYYTGSAGCVADAPHFSYGYYIAVANVVGSAFSILGAVLFQFMQRWHFRSAFVFTTCIQVVASVFDLLIIGRWNIRAGISDAAIYLFGDAACQSVAGQLQMMPMQLLTARLCPRGAESTVFALLAGFQNFGSNVASVLGVQLAETLGVEATRDGPCNFDNLNVLVVISHCVFPIACLPLTLCLIPVARIDDDLAFSEISSAPSFMSPTPSPRNSASMSEKAAFSMPDGVVDEYGLMEDDGVQGMRQVTF